MPLLALNDYAGLQTVNVVVCLPAQVYAGGSVHQQYAAWL